VDLQVSTNDESAMRERGFMFWYHSVPLTSPKSFFSYFHCSVNAANSVVDLASIFYLFILLPYYHLTIVIIGSLLMFYHVIESIVLAYL
jgi:hypothetical protein